jgi:hypothetical protein
LVYKDDSQNKIREQMTTAAKEIRFVPYVATDATGGKRVVPLLAPAPTRKPDYATSDDVDAVINWFLMESGWDISKSPNAVTPTRVAMFMVWQMTNLPLETLHNVWLRIVQIVIPDEVSNNAFWKMMIVPGGGLTFAPSFWIRLFKSIECRLNPEMTEINPVLKAFHMEALRAGVTAESRILPLAFLPSLVGRGMQRLLDDAKFQKYLFGGHAERQQVLNLKNYYQSLQIKDYKNLEEACVLVLASSYFRRMPLVPDAERINRVPFIASALEESKRKQADADKAAREAYDRENAARMVGVEKPESKPSSSRYDYTAGGPPPLLPPDNIGAGAQTMSGGAAPSQKQPDLPPYPSDPSETVNDIVRIFNATKEPLPVKGPRSELLSTVGRDPDFVKVFDSYCSATGIERMANPIWLLRSVCVCYFGGDHWAELHGETLKEFGHIGNPDAARAALAATVGEAQVRKLIDLADNQGIGITGVPAEVHRVIGIFGPYVQQWLKYADATKFDRDVIKMLLVIHHQSGSEKDLAHFWRDIYGWSYNDKIVELISSWKRAHEFLPTPIRAYALRLMLGPI